MGHFCICTCTPEPSLGSGSALKGSGSDLKGSGSALKGSGSDLRRFTSLQPFWHNTSCYTLYQTLLVFRRFLSGDSDDDEGDRTKISLR